MRKETFRIIKNAAFLLFEKGASRLVSVFFLAALGRVLGEAPLGQYVSVLALVSIAEAVSALGTQRILVRNISQNPEQGSRYFSSATIFLFLFGLACLVMLIALARLLGYSRDMLVLLAIAGASIPASTVSRAVREPSSRHASVWKYSVSWGLSLRSSQWAQGRSSSFWALG